MIELYAIIKEIIKNEEIKLSIKNKIEKFLEKKKRLLPAIDKEEYYRQFGLIYAKSIITKENKHQWVCGVCEGELSHIDEITSYVCHVWSICTKCGKLNHFVE